MSDPYEDFQATGYVYDPNRPVTGNIYLERFSDQGRRYSTYYIDCAVCGQEGALFGVSRRVSARKAALNQGYVIGPYQKWICPKCARMRTEKQDKNADEQE